MARVAAFALALICAGELRADEAPSSSGAPSSSAASTASTSAPSAPAVRRAETAPAAPTAGLTSSPRIDDARRSTPRRALAGFLRAADAGDYAKASEFLDLRGIPRGRDKREATDLATMLHSVLVWRVALDPEALPDEPDPEGIGPDGIVLDTVDLDGDRFTLALAKVRLANGETAWLFPKETVSAIRPIYEASERRAVEERVPEWLKQSTWSGLRPWQWLGLLALAVASYAIGRLASVLTMAAAVGIVSRVSKPLRDFVASLRRPMRLALGAVTFQLALPYLLLPAAYRAFIERVPTTLYVVAAAWAAIAVVRVGTATWERRLPVDTEGDLMSRGTRTRLTMLRRVATVLVVLVAGGVILLQFDVVRSVGLSLLASAGIAGVLVGFAAQRSLGGIIAGIELSITQPLRIGDIVVFRTGETGKVEHIYFTYVVVKLWDERRLIVPVTRVMGDAFENWTRTGGELLAPVDLWVDLAAPVDAFRAAFEELCKNSVRWDRRQAVVQVVDVTDRAMLLRGIASVDDASRAYDFRCELREGWVTFLRGLEGGRFLPHGRVASAPIDPAANGASAAPGEPDAGPPSTKLAVQDAGAGPGSASGAASVRGAPEPVLPRRGSTP
ncbi:MAG TPA: mechanosensitive ion channel domain-containing protein [Polyangiaceae bacterium]|nr:mechanosensitive ion channel domain-containing protein [Polyangiaceae bacterium]